MKKKILNGSVSSLLEQIYDVKSLNLLLLSDFILVSLYSFFGTLSSIFNGLSAEENYKMVNVLISSCTLVPLFIIYNHSKSILQEKRDLVDKKAIIDNVKQELGLNEISEIRVVPNFEENVRRKRVFDVTLKDKQGNTAYLKEYIDYIEESCETYLNDDVKRRTLK